MSAMLIYHQKERECLEILNANSCIVQVLMCWYICGMMVYDGRTKSLPVLLSAKDAPLIANFVQTDVLPVIFWKLYLIYQLLK